MEKQTSLFEREEERPLADRLRPTSLEEFVGQKKLVGEGALLRTIIESDRLTSLIFWGPPGVGKTTLAEIIAQQTKSSFINYSAVTSGIKEIKDVMEEAEKNHRLGVRTVLFIDEIHRFNKAQQDAFLPYVEKGSIILIGATTENPSFTINNALLSRCKVFVLEPLTTSDIVVVLDRALHSPKGFGSLKVSLPTNSLELIANFSNGDARSALSTLDMAITNGKMEGNEVEVSESTLKQCLSNKSLLYDKKGEEHYNLISALHKSMRNSDPDAAIYWLARMLEAGEDPLYIARRLIRFSSEDVGLSDPHALEIAVACYSACHSIGVPECNVNLTECVVYLSLAPKSNALYLAYGKARDDALTMLDEPVPLIIRNAPTKLMGEIGYGKGYEYAHDFKDKLTSMTCLPEKLQGKEYYSPTSEGLEEKYKLRLASIKEWKKKHQ